MAKEKKTLKVIIRDESFVMKKMDAFDVVLHKPFVQYEEQSDHIKEGVSEEAYYSYLDDMYYNRNYIKRSLRGKYSNEHNRTIFSLYALNANENIKKLLNLHAQKLVYVTDGRIWPYFSIKLFISERTESVEVFVPNRYDDPFFKDKSDYEILRWAFNNIQFVPVMIREETFDDDGASHKWFHIKANREMVEKLQDYLSDVKYPPKSKVYYFIKKRKNSKGKTIWYLKRDEKMSPVTINK